jgi:heme exporter protein B
MRFLRQTLTIAHKDLRAELRSKEALNASVSFAVVILLLFSFAFDPTAEQTREMAGGLLWIVFAFAGALVLNRSFSRELPNDCLDALVASPVSGAALFLGKALTNMILQCSLDRSVLVLDAGAGAGDMGTHGNRDHVQRAHRQSPFA